MNDVASEDRWKPPGNHPFHYRVAINPDGKHPIKVSVLIPSFETINIASAHIERIGGPCERDNQFRSQLYYIIGAATVASGHIEAAMQRLLILTKGNKDPNFALEGRTWSQLHDELRIEATEKGPPENALLASLQWAEKNHIQSLRDKFVHSYWWDLADVGVVCTRFERQTLGTTIVGTLEELVAQTNLMLSYAAMLDAIVGSHWLNFYLPSEPVEKAQG